MKRRKTIVKWSITGFLIAFACYGAYSAYTNYGRDVLAKNKTIHKTKKSVTVPVESKMRVSPKQSDTNSQLQTVSNDVQKWNNLMTNMGNEINDDAADQNDLRKYNGYFINTQGFSGSLDSLDNTNLSMESTFQQYEPIFDSLVNDSDSISDDNIKALCVDLEDQISLFASSFNNALSISQYVSTNAAQELKLYQEKNTEFENYLNVASDKTSDWNTDVENLKSSHISIENDENKLQVYTNSK